LTVQVTFSYLLKRSSALWRYLRFCWLVCSFLLCFFVYFLFVSRFTTCAWWVELFNLHTLILYYTGNNII